MLCLGSSCCSPWQLRPLQSSVGPKSFWGIGSSGVGVCVFSPLQLCWYDVCTLGDFCGQLLLALLQHLLARNCFVKLVRMVARFRFQFACLFVFLFVCCSLNRLLSSCLLHRAVFGCLFEVLLAAVPSDFCSFHLLFIECFD